MRTFAIILITLCALGGVIAGICSGFGNYSAFQAMSAGTKGNWVWGFVGVACTLTSAGAFGMAFLTGANGGLKMAILATVVGFVAGTGSVQGSKLYMDNGKAFQTASAENVLGKRERLSLRIENWRGDLEDIPEGVGQPGAIRRYMQEVERVGKSYQKPYRDAIIELGFAERRAELEANIEDAETALFGDPDLQIIVPAKTINGWFMAILIELINAFGLALAWAGAATLYREYKDAQFMSAMEASFAE